ncbi:beta strand repeat-containing protein [Plantibacter sp. CFBP 13570]|uniref:beta strand repeat-containing protein n=1 Tax=Plantibacter sp. CFBP 13570 TaxID=2775272 RepID=UPI001BB3801D|nr:DUF11 domain-containing protein [Plantibacter sp. CFBP 13570]
MGFTSCRHQRLLCVAVIRRALNLIATWPREDPMNSFHLFRSDTPTAIRRRVADERLGASRGFARLVHYPAAREVRLHAPSIRTIGMMLVMMLLVSLLSAFQMIAAPTARAATVSCTNTIYSVDWDSGNVLQIALGSSGQAANAAVSTTVGDLGANGTARYNALALSSDGTTLFAADQTTGNFVYRMDVTTGAVQAFPVLANISGSIIGGAVNPQNGYYYILTYGTTPSLYAFNPTTNSWIGLVASFSGTAAGMNGTNISDFAFDSNGIGFFTANTTSNGHSLYRWTGPVPSAAGNASLVPVLITPNLLANDNAIGSLAFGSNGNLYLGQIASPQITQLNSTTGDVIDRSGAPIPGRPVDFASCSSPNTLTVQKNIVSRAQAADQFAMSIGGLQTPVTATTTGTSTGVQDQRAGTVVVAPGESYPVSETASSGASLTDYSTTWQCLNTAGAVISSGDGASFTYSPPPSVGGRGQAVTCTFSNAALTQAYTVTKSASTPTTVAGATLTYTVTVQNTGARAYTSNNPASFTDDLTDVLDDATYANDATEGATITGNTLSWAGTLAVGQTRTITYSVIPKTPGQGNANLINAVTPTGTGGTCATPGGCTTTTPVQALRISKVADQSDVVPGQTIAYTVTVQNTGAVDYTAADPASFSDDLTAVLDDASWDDNATATAGALSFTSPTLSWSGPIAAGETVTVTYSVTVNDPPSGDSQIDNAVTSTTPGNNCPTGNTDPACIVQIPSGSYTVQKAASTGVVNPGDIVTYTVTVTNTGEQAYTETDPASFSDDLTAVLDDATYNDDASAGATVSGNTLAWSGALPVGQSVVVTYSVTVNNPDTGDKTLTNTVVPTSPGGRCPTAGDCTTTTNVRSYTVEKTASTQTATPGTVVTYTVTVTNTGTAAYTTDAPASFSDDLSAVLDDATYNDDTTATSGNVSFTSPTLSWSGPLDVGSPVSVTYTVTVNAAGTGDKTLTNTVTPTAPSGTCTTEGGCTTTTQVQSFTVDKTASASTVTPGSVLTYTVTVTNTGQIAYTAEAPASFSDDLSAVLDDATYNDDATAGATLSGNTLSWSGALPIGETVTVTYSVTVKQPNTGDNVLTNAVTPTGPGGACATEGGCVTNTPVQSIAFTKTADTTEVVPGATVTYTITATNTGQVDYTTDAPATFTDDLSAVLDDADYNGDASATGGAIIYTAPTLSWSGPVAVGTTITITYTVTVNSPDTGDSRLENTVVSEAPGGNCPAGSTDPACVVELPSGSFFVEKTASSESVTPGSSLSYTVTVTNTGQVAYTTDKPASFSDDLTAVLDDATYNGDAAASDDTGVVSFTTPTLSWSGALPVGETVTVTYSVTVKQPNTGDNVLTNAVTPTGPGGACATEGGCVTNTPVQSIAFTKTADTTEVVPGATVTYTITATNTGQVDYTTDAPATFTDDLSAVLDDADYNGDANATGGAIIYTAPTLTWAGPVAVGTTVTISYTVTVNDPDTGDKILANTVVSNVPGSNCVEGVGDPNCTSTVPAGSYSVAKQASTTSAVQGSTITYTVTVTNTGSVSYTDAAPASFRDTLTQVLDDASYNGDVTATAGAAAFTAPNLSWSGPLAVGQAVTVTYSVTVNSPDTGDRKVVNAVVPTGPGGSCSVGACTTTTDVPPGLLVHTGGSSSAGVTGLGGFGAAVLALMIALGAAWSFSRRQARS